MWVTLHSHVHTHFQVQIATETMQGSEPHCLAQGHFGQCILCIRQVRYTKGHRDGCTAVHRDKACRLWYPIMGAWVGFGNRKTKENKVIYHPVAVIYNNFNV